jgi:hypothetical protein
LRSIQRGSPVGAHEAIGHCGPEPLRQAFGDKREVDVGVGATGMATIDEADGQVVADDHVAESCVTMNDDDVFAWHGSLQPFEQRAGSDIPIARRKCARIDLAVFDERPCPPQPHCDAFVERTAHDGNGVQCRQRARERQHDDLGRKIGLVRARSCQGLAQDRNEVTAIVHPHRRRYPNALLPEPSRALDFLSQIASGGVLRNFQIVGGPQPKHRRIAHSRFDQLDASVGQRGAPGSREY